MQSTHEAFFPKSRYDLAWIRYKAGTYNLVYRAIDYETAQVWALKKPKNTSDIMMNQMNAPERFVRKNSEINPGFPCQITPGYNVFLGIPADKLQILPLEIYIHIKDDIIFADYRDIEHKLYSRELEDLLSPNSCRFLKARLSEIMPVLSKGQSNTIIDALGIERTGTIMPFIGDELPSDDESATKILEVYTRTRNIIADACIPGNILCFQGEKICIDLDLALHRDSETSIEYLETPENIDRHEEFWDESYRRGINPKSIDMIRTLFYLEDNLLHEGIILDEYLTPELIDKYHILREQNITISRHYIQVLNAIIMHDPKHIQHAKFISTLLLDAIDLNTEDLSQHIKDNLIECMSIDALISREIIGRRDSLYGFYAPAPAPALAQSDIAHMASDIPPTCFHRP